MKEAVLYKEIKNNIVRCKSCSHYCNIMPDKTGVCGIRKNIQGRLYLLPYGMPVAVHTDPIEKKPLFHFMQGTCVFSIGTVGCNFACEFCQNWDISQFSKGRKSEDIENIGEKWAPEEIVKYCVRRKIPSIAYTYNEPTIFIEYAHDTMRLAHKHGIKNVFVSNGYGSPEAYEYIKDYLDAINIDFKSFSPEFYQKICHARIEPVLENIKRLYDYGIWVELTTLVITGQNDSDLELKKIACFIADIDKNIPWHVSRFFPSYNMSNVEPTSPETLRKAYDIGKEAGLNFVYVGNMRDSDMESTYCPNCNKKVIERSGYEIGHVKISDGRCLHCNFKISGRFV